MQADPTTFSKGRLAKILMQCYGRRRSGVTTVIKQINGSYCSGLTESVNCEEGWFHNMPACERRIMKMYAKSCARLILRNIFRTLASTAAANVPYRQSEPMRKLRLQALRLATGASFSQQLRSWSQPRLQTTEGAEVHGST